MNSTALRSARNRSIGLRVVGALVVGAATLGLGACTSSHDDHRSASSTANHDHNAADVAFATGMIPHHRQAVEMSQLAATRASDPRVIELATQVSAAQGPEIDELSARLRAWGQPVPTSSESMDHGSMDHGSMDHGAMDHGSMSGDSMVGMMSAEDMSTLAGLRGTAFDRQWLTMMIAHHTGAVAMARTELADGSDADSTRLARRIIDAQEAEIVTMRAILAD